MTAGQLIGTIGVLFGLALPVQAELLQIPTGRGDTVPVYWDKVADAKATVFLFNGGTGFVPFNKNGMPRGQNFLLKSYPLFAAKGVNVVVVGMAQGHYPLVASADDRVLASSPDVGTLIPRKKTDPPRSARDELLGEKLSTARARIVKAKQAAQ